MATLIRPLPIVAALLMASTAQAQRIAEWTEEAGELGLGYPVPMPVDTPFPFDGFRTYDGLHTRHQSLMLDFDVVDGEIINQTRQGRDIWAYKLSDADSVTREGLPEPATMIQGGIHAREWQSPEVVTGIMERLTDNHDDQYIHQYLLENVNMVILPVHNIDGFMQTQRYPSMNYLDSDINNPATSPRDGRMRRKNMLGVDEVLETVDDHLMGVDLNRNNPPFWATSNRSSPDNRSLVHHGAGPHSEPETQAMAATAANLGPADRLRIYTDVHSFSQVHFSVLTNNTRRNAIQAALLFDFSEHHVQLEGDKRYFDVPGGPGGGIGSTDEYFALTYQIPSWTLEVEPSNGNPAFGLPGVGADYGGFATNGHDGFILPESQVRRVRQNLAESFIVAYYHQAGPPSVAQVQLIDKDNGAIVMDSQWDQRNGQRTLHQQMIQPMQQNREYTLKVTYDKPMRWRVDNQVAALPGQSTFNLTPLILGMLNGNLIGLNAENQRWLNSAENGLESFYRYAFDSYAVDITVTDSFSENDLLTLDIVTGDMVGQQLDANPATPVDWSDGHWVGYEDEDGSEGDSGGRDRTQTIPLTLQNQTVPFLVRPGNSAAYFDPSRNGEGFLVEILENNVAVIYWFTYDENGNQNWYTGSGQIIGNVLEIKDLFSARGPVFGDNFDASLVELTNAGQLTFIFEDCNTASLRFVENGRILRQDLARLTSLADLSCDAETPNQNNFAGFSGSWFNALRSGEGIIVQIFSENQGLAYWFTYDDQGNAAWVFGTGTLDENGVLNITAANRTSGGIFGDEFDPAQIVLEPWGEFSLNLGCEQASVTYNSTLPAFGSGQIDNLEPLTNLAGTACN